MLYNLSRIKQMMDVNDFEAIVATTRENIIYLTGIDSVSLRLFPYDGQCYVLILRSKINNPYFISFKGEADQILDSDVSFSDIICFGEFYRELPPNIELTRSESRLYNATNSHIYESPIEALIKTIKNLKLDNKKIGIDEIGLRYGYLNQLKINLPNANIEEMSKSWRWVRKVKTEEEIKRLKISAAITENAIIEAASYARVGITELEMANRFNQSVINQGGLPRLTLIRFGRNAVSGQVNPGHTTLMQGDIIWFDCDSEYLGYWSDIARVYSFGTPSDYYVKTYNALLSGQQFAIEHAKAGQTGADIFNMVMGSVHNSGFSAYKRHHVGHGIGLEAYEYPILSSMNTDYLEDGCVINVETPYYEYGLGALHVEDPIHINKNGNQLLSSTDRELRIIE